MTVAEIGILETSGKLTELADKLGLIESIKQKLIKHPDVAATKLAAVLEELQKSLLAFESEVVRFLAITLETGPKLREDKASLYALEGQALWARMNAARGHCHKINNINEKYLDPWFQRVTELDKEERQALKDLFNELSDSDGMMLGMLNRATWWLSQQAKSVLDLYEAGRIDEANQLIAESRHEILPVRRVLSRTMYQLQDLEADFILMSGVA